MSESPRRRLFGRSAEPSITEDIPRPVRVAAAWSWRLLLISLAITAVVWLVVQLRIIVVPVLIALLIAALLVPYKNFLQRHRWPKWLAVLTAFLSLLIVVAGLVTLWVTQVMRGTKDIAHQTQQAWDEWSRILADSPLHITDQQLDAWFAQLQSMLTTDSSQWIHGALTVGTTLGHVLAGLLLALFSTLFFLIDGRGIWIWILGLFPQKARVPLDGAGRAGWKTLTNFVRVQILVAFMDGLGIGIGAALLGVPMAVPIGIMVFLGSFIPIVGAIVTGIIAVFIALVYNGPVVALILLGVVLLVHQVEGHVFQPLIMGTAVKVHPLAVVLAVATGSFLAGIAGALFAVPLAATVNVMVSYLSRKAWLPDAPPATREPMWSTVPTRPRRNGEFD